MQEVEFDDFAFEDDELVSIPAEESTAKGKQVKANQRGSLTPEQREARFNELFVFVKAHTGRHNLTKHGKALSRFGQGTLEQH